MTEQQTHTKGINNLHLTEQGTAGMYIKVQQGDKTYQLWPKITSLNVHKTRDMLRKV